MGRVSEELKSLKKIEEDKLKQMSLAERKLAKHKKRVASKPKQWVEGVDYHWIAVSSGSTAPKGWVFNGGQNKLDLKDIKAVLKNTGTYKEQAAYLVPMKSNYGFFFSYDDRPRKKPKEERQIMWFLYRGAPPNPEWGELCP